MLDTGEYLTADPRQPVVLVIAGPNGAGKSTSAPLLVHQTAGIDRYLNADAIARGFSPFEPDLSAIAAGRLLIAHMTELRNARQSFAIETTLAGVRLAQHLSELRISGYRIHMFYLWLPSADIAVARVNQRVALGGHSIPEETIRRRYVRSLRNLIEIYQPIVDSWRVFDNAQATPALIAKGGLKAKSLIVDTGKWADLRASAFKEDS